MNATLNITLNIGLSASRNYLLEGVAGMQMQYEYVQSYLKRTLGKPIQIGVAQSTTEKTVVVQYSNADIVLPKLEWIAYELNQDCIAYYVQDDGVTVGGALVGKYAHEWNYGVFNKDYFIPAPFKTELNPELNLELA